MRESCTGCWISEIVAISSDTLTVLEIVLGIDNIAFLSILSGRLPPDQRPRARTIALAGGLAKASRDFDLVVIGAAKEPLFRKILIGEIPQQVARYSPASVLVVKRYVGPVKTLLKRILG